MITLRNPVDGSTVEADPNDTDRLDRLTKLGYRVAGKPRAEAPATKAPATKAPARKRTAKK